MSARIFRKLTSNFKILSCPVFIELIVCFNAFSVSNVKLFNEPN